MKNLGKPWKDVIFKIEPEKVVKGTQTRTSSVKKIHEKYNIGVLDLKFTKCIPYMISDMTSCMSEKVISHQ